MNERSLERTQNATREDFKEGNVTDGDFFQTLCVCVCVCFIYYFFNEYVRVHSYFLIFSSLRLSFRLNVTNFFVADMNIVVIDTHGEEDDENNNLNGPRRLLAENLDYQQMELTTEDREDHTFNGTKLLLLLFSFFTSRRLSLSSNML